MKKKVLLRMVFGLFSGVLMSYLITIGISLVIGDGIYYPCVPSLAEQFHNEMTAVLIQMLLSALLGAGFAGCSVIWEMEKWSLLKQTGIYFAIVSVLMLTIAYTLHWMEHSVAGFVSYFAIFFGIFAIVWLVQFCAWKNKIAAINGKIRENRASDDK